MSGMSVSGFLYEAHMNAETISPEPVAGIAARRVERHLRDPSHVDANRGQGPAGAKSEG